MSQILFGASAVAWPRTSRPVAVGCRCLLVALAISAAGFPASADRLVRAQDQAAAGETELWQGALDLGAVKLRLEFHLVRDEAGGWSGKMISVDQGGTSVPLDRVTRSDGDLELEIKALEFTFRGNFSDDAQSIQGSMTQFGRKFPLALARAKPLGKLSHLESWQGTLQAGSKTFEFQIRMMQAEDGTRVGQFDSLSDHMADLRLELDVAGNDFRFKLPATQAAFAGTLNESKTQIAGHWLQAGQRIPLTFTKVDLAETKHVEPPQRPQTPKEPYPYEAREVEFANAEDQVRLAGTLTIPRGAGPYPAAILVSGSGPQDRDESLLDHKPFLVLADHLTRAGFAVLRYDDRGTGKSTGKFGSATSLDFARDATAALDFLRQQPGIAPEQVGFIGHSEGGLIGPLVAADRPEVAFLVLLAGPGVPGRTIIENQTELISRAEALPADQIERELALQREVLALVSSGKPDEEIRPLLTELIDRRWQQMSPDEQKIVTKEMMASEISKLQSPWIKFFLTYDPRPTLARVKCPTLVVNGQLDLQVDPKLNLPEIRRAFESAGKTNFEIVELERLNHLFQTASSGAPSEYRAIEETMAPLALQTITDYLRRICQPSVPK